jgi:hypothetical protein
LCFRRLLKFGCGVESELQATEIEMRGRPTLLRLTFSSKALQSPSSPMPFEYCLPILRILGGFLASVILGDLVIRPLNKWMWDYAGAHHPDLKSEKTTTFPPRKGDFTPLLGMVERFLYTAALMLGLWEWIPIWLTAKSVAQWKGDRTRPSDNIWLIGNALSIVFAYIGACIALGVVPKR